VGEGDFFSTSWCAISIPLISGIFSSFLFGSIYPERRAAHDPRSCSTAPRSTHISGLHLYYISHLLSGLSSVYVCANTLGSLFLSFYFLTTFFILLRSVHFNSWYPLTHPYTHDAAALHRHQDLATYNITSHLHAIFVLTSIPNLAWTTHMQRTYQPNCIIITFPTTPSISIPFIILIASPLLPWGCCCPTGPLAALSQVQPASIPHRPPPSLRHFLYSSLCIICSRWHPSFRSDTFSFSNAFFFDFFCSFAGKCRPVNRSCVMHVSIT